MICMLLSDLLCYVWSLRSSKLNPSVLLYNPDASRSSAALRTQVVRRQAHDGRQRVILTLCHPLGRWRGLAGGGPRQSKLRKFNPGNWIFGGAAQLFPSRKSWAKLNVLRTSQNFIQLRRIELKIFSPESPYWRINSRLSSYHQKKGPGQ